jgi:hypothetical protein
MTTEIDFLSEQFSLEACDLDLVKEGEADCQFLTRDR